jgi:hypothetical protein
MPTPREGYRLADGTKVPGVTTIIGGNLGWGKEGLMWWANQEGLAGRNHRDTSQAAADAGTLAHAMVEAHIHGLDYVPPADVPADQLAKARKAFGAYCEWESDTRLVIVATEIRLVSERHRFGATPDAVALRASKGLVLPDWKSSKGTYADHLLQLAAYGHVFEEVTGLELVGGYYLCRFDKASGGFSVKWWPREALDGAWRAFVMLRELHDLKAGVEALAK